MEREIELLRDERFDSNDDDPTTRGNRTEPAEDFLDAYSRAVITAAERVSDVYRADDLKLAQPVALKLLPERLSEDGATLARFHREVSIARQVSDPNVCRVFDIGEVGGLHFLSMEYIDGKDLGSLSHRLTTCASKTGTR